MQTVITEKIVKKKKPPVKRNEGVVMVTYSTMSCSGLPVSGARLTDHSWPSGRQQHTHWGRGVGWGRQGLRQGEGALPLAVYTRRQLSAAPVWHTLTLSPNLFACVLSCFLQLLIVQTAKHSLGKSETLLSDHYSKSASCRWVKFSKGSVLLIVPESLSHHHPHPPPHTPLEG